ncbi:hypothetical protein [Pseudonocardia sp. NPDC049635]|uniref:hypothetical protein n=1 Tax=Pseudonocardia sp. NPDC049635 TaxID=3155506 RepID=UPI00340B217B
MNAPEPRVETRDVDPELAKEWLGQNIRNRPVKWRKVDQYARDIAAGRWQLTGDAIRFDTTGKLIDGQNRLHAVIQADTPIRTFVMWNLDPDAQDAMDSGAARTAGDVLTMTGVPNGQAVAAAARIAMALEVGNKTNGVRLTNTEVQR